MPSSLVLIYIYCLVSVKSIKGSNLFYSIRSVEYYPSNLTQSSTFLLFPILSGPSIFPYVTMTNNNTATNKNATEKPFSNTNNQSYVPFTLNL